MDFAGMKRKELQALCKKHGIPANLANREMAHRLALLLQEDERPAVSDRETEPVVVAKNNVKKVKFSPENETFIFIGSDSDSDSDYVSERRMRLRSRKSMRKNVAKRKKIEEEKNVTGKVRVARRSPAKSVSVLEEDSKLVSLPVKGRKRGLDIVDASEPKRVSTGRQLRRGKLVNEAAGNGDMVVSGDKITREVWKNTVDGKASVGVLLEGQVFEDAEAEEAPKPEKMNMNSKQKSTKDKGSGVASAEGIAKVGIGGKTTRAAKRKKIEEEKNVDGKVRVVKRSQAKSVSVLEEDSKLVSLTVKGRKKGPEIVDVFDSKRVSTGRQLRRGKLVNEAGGNGDMVVSGDKIMQEGSKKTVDGKAGDGVLSEGQVFEDTEAEEAPKPEKISKISKQNSTKDKGSGVAPTEGIAKIGIGGKTTRARTRAFRTGSAVDSECEEPLKGLANNETTMEKNPKKRPKKQDLEEVSDIRTNSDATEQFVPQGPMRRTRQITRLFSPDGLTVSTNEETHETMNRERGANRGNPTRQSARVSSIVAEIAELASKKGQKKQRQDPTLNQQSFVNAQEPSNNKHPRRSTTLDDFKVNNVELLERTLMGSAAEKEKLKTSSLLIEGSPVIDVNLAAPEALESKIDPDLQCNKSDTPRSSENRKEFRRKSALASPLHSASGSAVNEVATDTILDLEGQGPSSAKHQGISMIEPTMESAIELLIKEKESSTIEEVKENSWDENIEGGADDPLHNSLDTGVDSSDYQLVQQVEDSKKDIDVDAIIPDSSLSVTNQVDSEGECSNCLDIEERLETEEAVIGNSIRLRSNEVYDQSYDGDRANDDSGQDLLNEVAESRVSERYSKNLFEDTENTCPNFSQAINTEMVEKIHFCNVTPSNSSAVQSEPATESQDVTKVLDEPTLSSETGCSLECVQARHDEKTEVIGATKEQESEEALNRGLPSVGAISIDIPCNLDDPLVGEGADNVNESGYGNTLKNTYGDILAPRVEADATCARRVDLENIESANKQVKEHSPEVKLSSESSSKNPEAYSTTCLLLNVSSPHGNEYGSQNFSQDKNGSTKKEATAEDKENRGAGNDKSNAGKSIEDPSDATNDLTHKYNVSIPEFSEELFDGYKGAAEEAASVNDNSLTQDQHLCDKGTDNVVKRTEGALDFHAMDGKPMRDDDLQKVGALADSSFHSEMIQNVNVNCFVSSPDKRNSEHHVHTAEVTLLVINTSLRSGEEANVEYARDLVVEANTGSENDLGKKEIEENVVTTEDFDQVFESQLGEQDHHTTEPAVSNDQISGDCKGSNEQDDVSAIIQEYMDCETHIDELTKMDSSGLLNEGKMTRVSVEDAETNSVAELGLDKIFNDCGEDEETLETSTKRMEIVEEDKVMVADVTELPKTNNAAPTNCTANVPVNCKISETSNVNLQTTTQSDEVKIEDVESNMEVSPELEGSASMALDNSGFRDRKATTSKEKVGRVCGDSNSQAINFLAKTKVNEDSVPDVFSDDIHDKLVYEEAHGWNDDDPDTALVSTHGRKAVLIDESGDESLEGRIGSDDIEFGSELHKEALNSPPKVEESCRLDEKDSTAIKLMVDSTICSPLTGKESECQAYKKRATNCMEGMKLENMDGGIISREIDSPKQGNIELGSYQRGSQHRLHCLKEGCQTDDVDFLELNNLFSSNSSKINFKQTGKDLDFQNSANLEVTVGASKDATGLEEVQYPAVSLVTPDSNASMRLTTTEFPSGRKIDNDTADSDAAIPLFTGFELNLFSEDSQRVEVDKTYHRRLEENLMSDTNGDMKGGDTAVNISTVSVEQGFHLENEMVVDIDFLKQTQLVASDEPNNEIEGSKQEAMAFEVSIKAINVKEDSGASVKSPFCDANNAKVAGNYKSSGSKDVTSFGMTSLEVSVEKADWNKYGLEVNATTINAASDGLVTECRGSAEKGGAFVETEGAIEFENTMYFAASGETTAECGADNSKQVESSHLEETGTEVVPALIKNDSSEDMYEAADLSKGALVTNVQSLDVASDEPIFGNRGTNDKCDVSIINQESADCEYTKDDFVELEKCQETTEIEGSSSASNKRTTEFGGKDSNKGDTAPLNLDVEAAVSEDAQARQAEFEFGQENSSVTNLCQSINQFANPTRMNNINVSIPATPKILQKAHDMKENFPSAKREQFGSVVVSRKSAKRRPLEDLQKN